LERRRREDFGKVIGEGEWGRDLGGGVGRGDRKG